MQAYVGTIVCKFGVDPAISVVEEAIFLQGWKKPRFLKKIFRFLGF